LSASFDPPLMLLKPQAPSPELTIRNAFDESSFQS
jgi:hypothetical protein